MNINGGEWLGAARNWLLWKKRGSNLTWGSNEAVQMTVKDCEELAEAAVTAERERCAKLAELPVPHLKMRKEKEDLAGGDSRIYADQIHVLEWLAKKIRE